MLLPGFTPDQLDDAQARYGLSFPPDLLEALQEHRLDERYDWSVECPAVREMLAWPFELLQFDIEHGSWWPDWGERPAGKDERDEVLRSALARAPKLIPLYGHRFLPETPGEPGNPVFSMHGFDTIYYGDDLAGWLKLEFGSGRYAELVREPRYIPFWSDLVERYDEGDELCARDTERGLGTEPSRE